MRPQDLEQHFLQELDRLFKLSSASSRPRPPRPGLPPPGPADHGAHGQLLHTPSAADGTPYGRWETYKRIKANRQVRVTPFVYDDEGCAKNFGLGARLKKGPRFTLAQPLLIPIIFSS